mmetsp:Transcript_88412/g.274856  ORF Transcript_88412/g.274856 Transcript_88412/m.274856 type:complete len:224 (+) Transcript_88412:357-1028(+)
MELLHGHRAVLVLLGAVPQLAGGVLAHGTHGAVPEEDVRVPGAHGHLDGIRDARHLGGNCLLIRGPNSQLAVRVRAQSHNGAVGHEEDGGGAADRGLLHAGPCEALDLPGLGRVDVADVAQLPLCLAARAPDGPVRLHEDRVPRGGPHGDVDDGVEIDNLHGHGPHIRGAVPQLPIVVLAGRHDRAVLQQEDGVAPEAGHLRNARDARGADGAGELVLGLGLP